MRKIFPDKEQTNALFNEDDNRATKQDIVDLSNQIEAVDDKVDGVASELDSFEQGLEESVNTSAITAETGNIGELSSTKIESNEVDATTIKGTNATIESESVGSSNITNLVAGDVKASNADIDNLAATSIDADEATIDEINSTEANLTTANVTNLNVENYNIENINASGDLNVAGDTTLKDVEADNIEADKVVSDEAEIAGLSTEEEKVVNIVWNGEQSLANQPETFYVVVPHFENGSYFIQILDNNVPKVTMEILNSVDNYLIRWSKEIGYLLYVYKLGEDTGSQIAFQCRKDAGEALTLKYATTSATPNVSAPTEQVTQPTNIKIRYQVTYENGNKFFRNVDLANQGSTIGTLTQTPTEVYDLDSGSFAYDTVENVNSVRYKPDQSVNTYDDVKFRTVDATFFDVAELGTLSKFKAPHIYDGRALSAAELAALEDESLVIQTGASEVNAPNGVTICWYAADYNEPPYQPWMQLKGLSSSVYDALRNRTYETTTYKPEDGYEIKTKTKNDSGAFYTIPFAPHQPVCIVYDSHLDEYGFLGFTDTDSWYYFPINSSNKYEADINGDVVVGTYDFLERIYWDPAMTEHVVEEPVPGDRVYTQDERAFTCVYKNVIIVPYTNIIYSSTGGGTSKLTRKTTKNSTSQVLPLIPTDTTVTGDDSLPLKYNSTKDAIEKNTTDLTVGNDLSVGGDASITGNATISGDETITGDATIGGDLNVTGEIDATLADGTTVNGDLNVENELNVKTIKVSDDVFIDQNLVVQGDLEVRGTTITSDVENVQSEGDYMVLRANNPVPLANNDYAGIVIHNYNSAGKDAALTVDNSGTFRLSTQTQESVSPLSNVWLVDFQYFEGSVDFSQATLFSENYPVTRYNEVFTDIKAYKSGNNHYFYDPNAETIVYYDNVTYSAQNGVQLAGSQQSFTPGPTDESHDVHFYTSISFMEPQASDMEPILTRDEEASMTDVALMKWDAADTRAKTIAVPVQNNTYLRAKVNTGADYHWSAITFSATGYASMLYEYPTLDDTVFMDLVLKQGTKPTPVPSQATTVSHTYNDYLYYTETNKVVSYDSVADKYYEVYFNTDGTCTVDTTLTIIGDPTKLVTCTIYSEKIDNVHGTHYEWGPGGGVGVAFNGTRADYEIAKLITEGNDGFIPSGALVIITDEDKMYVTSGVNAQQTLSLVSSVMDAGDGITITDNQTIKADTVVFTGTKTQWENLTTAQKAKYNKVCTTDEDFTNEDIVNSVTAGDMRAVTSNAVANAVTDLDNRKLQWAVSAGPLQTQNYSLLGLSNGKYLTSYTSLWDSYGPVCVGLITVYNGNYLWAPIYDPNNATSISGSNLHTSLTGFYSLRMLFLGE